MFMKRKTKDEEKKNGERRGETVRGRERVDRGRDGRIMREKVEKQEGVEWREKTSQKVRCMKGEDYQAKKIRVCM